MKLDFPTRFLYNIESKQGVRNKSIAAGSLLYAMLGFMTVIMFFR